MSTSNLSCNRASFQVEQAVCRSTESEIRELEDCSKMVNREQLAQKIVSHAIKRCLKRNCEVRVRKCGRGYVLTIVHPNSHLSEMLPSGATNWINAVKENQEFESLNFSIALPATILET